MGYRDAYLKYKSHGQAMLILGNVQIVFVFSSEDISMRTRVAPDCDGKDSVICEVKLPWKKLLEQS